jgi:hypothetical protein
VKQNPTGFTNTSLPFLDLHPSGFPSLVTNDTPEAILNLRAFSPLLEMAHGMIWHLTSNSELTTGSRESQKVFSTFVERGEMAITSESYFGAAIPGRLCANFAYHFGQRESIHSLS